MFSLVMEIDEERKATLEKMVATATTTERNIDQEFFFFASHIPNNLYLTILIVS